MIFDIGETIICSCEVESKGVLTDPTSMEITIKGERRSEEVDDEAMVRDKTGKYHYDFQTNTTMPYGTYSAIFKAIDGTRVTLQKESFQLG